MTGSFSTGVSPAGTAGGCCASSLVTPAAMRAGSRKPRSRREHFMVRLLVMAGPEGPALRLLCAALESFSEHRQLVDRLRVVSHALGRDELLAVGAERAAAD